MSAWTDTGSDYKQAPVGTFAARCVRVIELGTQTSQFGTKRKTMIVWELVDELMDNGKPFTISRFYTASLNEKAVLRQDLEAWRGRAFTEPELAGFAQSNILGKPCLITTIQEGDKVKVKSVAGVMKGMVVSEPVNEVFFYDVDAHDEEVFGKLSDKLKDMIRESPEWKARVAPKAVGAAAGVSFGSNGEIQSPEDLDEIPFS